MSKKSYIIFIALLFAGCNSIYSKSQSEQPRIQVFTSPAPPQGVVSVAPTGAFMGSLKVENNCLYAYDKNGVEKLLPIFPYGSDFNEKSGFIIKTLSGISLATPLEKPLFFSAGYLQPISDSEKASYTPCSNGIKQIINLYSYSDANIPKWARTNTPK